MISIGFLLIFNLNVLMSEQSNLVRLQPRASSSPEVTSTASTYSTSIGSSLRIWLLIAMTILGVLILVGIVLQITKKYEFSCPKRESASETNINSTRQKHTKKRLSTDTLSLPGKIPMEMNMDGQVTPKSNWPGSKTSMIKSHSGTFQWQDLGNFGDQSGNTGSRNIEIGLRDEGIEWNEILERNRHIVSRETMGTNSGNFPRKPRPSTRLSDYEPMPIDIVSRLNFDTINIANPSSDLDSNTYLAEDEYTENNYPIGLLDEYTKNYKQIKKITSFDNIYTHSHNMHSRATRPSVIINITQTNSTFINASTHIPQQNSKNSIQSLVPTSTTRSSESYGPWDSWMISPTNTFARPNNLMSWYDTPVRLPTPLVVRGSTLSLPPKRRAVDVLNEPLKHNTLVTDEINVRDTAISWHERVESITRKTEPEISNSLGLIGMCVDDVTDELTVHEYADMSEEWGAGINSERVVSVATELISELGCSVEQSHRFSGTSFLEYVDSSLRRESSASNALVSRESVDEDTDLSSSKDGLAFENSGIVVGEPPVENFVPNWMVEYILNEEINCI
ncbi:hypothetical protein HK096_006198 [Nowakowskiella sp. JEL0078]|nr:hypothetical protein HK096_006198 [Nowakowskiella sp. JEL0078]